MRIDAWVHAVRLIKTRSLAATACRAGHIKINDETVKPAQTVAVGDMVRVWNNHRETVVEVTRLIPKRVGAAIATTCYIDRTPPRPDVALLGRVGLRDRGAGRPTKKERRQLEAFRRREIDNV